MEHVHISVLQALLVFLMVALVGLIWKIGAMKLADKPIGKAMAFVYS